MEMKVIETLENHHGWRELPTRIKAAYRQRPPHLRLCRILASTLKHTSFTEKCLQRAFLTI